MQGDERDGRPFFERHENRSVHGDPMGPRRRPDEPDRTERDRSGRDVGARPRAGAAPRARRGARDRVDRDVRRGAPRRQAVAARERRGEAGAGDLRVSAVPPERRDARARHPQPPVLRRARLRRRAGRHARHRRRCRRAGGRVPPPRAARRARDPEVDRRPAVVRRKRRHGRHQLGRLQRPADGGAEAARAEGRDHHLQHRRPLRGRHPHDGRRAADRELRVGHDHAGQQRASAGPGDVRRGLAGRLARAAGRRRLLAGHLASPPAARRLLAARLGMRELRADHVSRLHDRRLGRRLHPYRLPSAREPRVAGDRPGRTVEPHAPEHRDARARHRLPDGGAALLGPLAEGGGQRRDGRARPARLDPGVRPARREPRVPSRPLGGRADVARPRRDVRELRSGAGPDRRLAGRGRERRERGRRERWRRERWRHDAG